MRRALLLVAVLSVSGCGAIKVRKHTLFCIGACIHSEGEVEKKGGEPPKKPAPVDDAAKG